MSKFIKAALSASVLVLGFTAVPAHAGKGHGKPPVDWSKCNQNAGCDAEIDITLEVEKKCELKGANPIVLDAKGGAKSSDYTITTNTPYVLNLSMRNTGTATTTYVQHDEDASIRVPTTVTTKKGSQNIPLGASNHDGVARDNYSVTVSTEALTALQRAGTYSDAYIINVQY